MIRTAGFIRSGQQNGVALPFRRACFSHSDLSQRCRSVENLLLGFSFNDQDEDV